jgi:hypothetical protein
MFYIFTVLAVAQISQNHDESSATGTASPARTIRLAEVPTGPWVLSRTDAQNAPTCTGRSEVVRGVYRSIQVNVDAWGCNIPGDAANEPSIAIDPTDLRKIVIGWRQFDSVVSDFRQAGYAISQDAGHTWVFPGSLTPGVFGSDPVLATNADGTVYYLSINIDEMRLFRSFDSGATWENPIQVIDSFADKPWLAIDRTNGIGRNNVYICSSGFYPRRSVDEGVTFASIPGGPSCWGGTICVDGDGGVYVAEGPTTIPIGIAKSSNAADPNLTPTFAQTKWLEVGLYSRDGGAPNGMGLLGQVWVAANPTTVLSNVHVYVLTLAGVDPLFVDPCDLVFVASADGGVTWGRPIVVNDDPLSRNGWQWFDTMSVAPNGRIDVIWNDTRNSQQPNLSEVYYSYSNDGGVTWSPNVPVSPMFDSRVGIPGMNDKLGDYYHMVSDNLGANLAYAATFNGEQDVYFLRIGPWDCNGNEIPDEIDILVGTSLDCNANGVPDECEYRADLDGDGLTTLTDYAAFASAMTGPAVAARGTCNPPSSPLCDGGGTPLPDGRGSDCDGTGLLDIDHDDDIDLADFYGLQRVFAGP